MASCTERYKSRANLSVNDPRTFCEGVLTVFLLSFHSYCLKVSSSSGILVVAGMFLSQLSIESVEQIHFLN